MTRLAPLALALALTGCTAISTAVDTAETDLATVAARAGSLCREVSPLVTLGDVAAALSGNIVATEVMGIAAAVRDKCVVIATAQQDLARGGSVSSSAATLLGNAQAISDLAGDVAVVKPVVRP